MADPTTPSISITATWGDPATSVTGPAEAQVDAGAKVTFTATLAGFEPTPSVDHIQWMHRKGTQDKDGTSRGTGPEFKVAGAAEADTGSYTATIDHDGTPVPSPPITLKLKEKPPLADEPKPPQGVAEVAVGEWSTFFGLLTGAVALACAALALNLAYRAQDGLGLVTPAPSLTKEAVTALPDRIFGSMAVLTACAGLLLLVAGAWMAAVETRGRMRADAGSDTPPLVGVQAKGELLDAEVVKAAGEAFGKLTSMRGAVAALGCGVILMAVSTTSSCHVATSARSAAYPSGSTAPTASTAATTSSAITTTASTTAP